MDIQTIHDSYMNGQRRQMASQIGDYDPREFFEDYRLFLADHFLDADEQYRHYSTVVRLYFGLSTY